MEPPSSLISGFHKMPIEERKSIVKKFYNFSNEDLSILSDQSSISPYFKKIDEGVVSNFEFPLKFVPNWKINGIDYIMPYAIIEQSVAPAGGYAAKLSYGNGGIQSKVSDNPSIPKARARIHYYDENYNENSNFNNLKNLIEEKKDVLLSQANSGHNNSKAYDIKFDQKMDMGVVEVWIDPGDSMGAAVAIKMADPIASLIYEKTRLKHNSIRPGNFAGRSVHSEMKILVEDLKRTSKSGSVLWSGKEVAYRIVNASKIASQYGEDAITNRKGTMNGMIAVANAFVQDTNAIEAANSSLINGMPNPLTGWSWLSDGDYLYGDLYAVIPCGVVGGEIENYPKAKLLLEKMQIKTGDKLAEILGAVGLAQNLSALSMITTIGITEGHGSHRK